MSKVSLGWFVSVSLLSLVGCGDFGWVDLRYQPDVDRKDTGQSALKRVQSAEEWVAFFRDQITARQEQYLRGGVAPGGVVFGSAGSDGAAQPAPAAPEGDAAEGSGADFSNTNIQEFGVDESDVVKTDGEYLYMLVGTELRIVKAYPTAELSQVGAVALDGTGYYNSSLYLNGDRIIAITQPQQFYFYEPLPGGVEGDAGVAAPGVRDAASPVDIGFYYENPKTVVTLVDVSDRANPAVEAEWQFDGYLLDSRMVGGILHLMTYQSPYVPLELDPDTLTVADIEKYIPAYEVSFADGSSGSGMLVPWNDFYRPIDPDGYNITTVISLDTNVVPDGFASIAVMADPGTVYASTEALYLTDPSYDYDLDYRETLDIHKFSFTASGAEYVASGSVEGRLINQFALSEHQGHLRVATTTGFPWAWDGTTSQNHVFVMSQNGDKLELVGSIRDLAAGEQIYSARFLGQRGFLVTFRQIDPLFTLDLADPANPKVAGELKVPGFSEYIHLMDDNHLLALGRAATEEGTPLGLQLSVFDVSDFARPQLMFSSQIGGPGTNSEAEYNHKAFTFYPQENLLAIPVNLYGPEWEYLFSGVQVYRVSLQDGISLAGGISTAQDTIYGYPSYYGWSRALFIEQSIYAVTEIGVKAAAMADPSAVLQSIELEGSPWVDIGPVIIDPVPPTTVGGDDGTSGDQTEPAPGKP